MHFLRLFAVWCQAHRAVYTERRAGTCRVFVGGGTRPRSRWCQRRSWRRERSGRPLVPCSSGGRCRGSQPRGPAETTHVNHTPVHRPHSFTNITTNAQFARQDLVAVRSGGGNQSGQAQTARPTALRRGRRYAQRWLISLKILYRVLTSHIYQQIIIKLDFRRIYFLSKTFNMAPTTEPGPGYTILPLVHCTPILDDTGNTHVSLLCLLCTRILIYISNCQKCLRPDRDGQPENIMPPVPNMVHTGWI